MIGVRPNKGLHDIIPIWQMVQKLRPDTTLTLMGGMSGEAEVVKEIERLKLPITVFKPANGFPSRGRLLCQDQGGEDPLCAEP